MLRQIAIVFLVLIALFVGGVLSLRFVLDKYSRVTTEQAIARTRQLVDRAGGASKICDEAASLFGRFGGSMAKLKFFHQQDLNDCPSLKTLGKVDGIWPSMDDSYIKIRVGNHYRGFEIHVFATSLRADVAEFLHERQVDSCIYVLD